MDILCKIKGLNRFEHNSLHSPNLHSKCEYGLDLTDNPTPILLGHEYYPFSATLPIPLRPPALLDKSSSNGIDPALQIVYKKELHNQLYKDLLDECHDVGLPEDVEKIMSYTSDAPILELDSTIVALAQHISKDPYPGFNEHYNSYYGNTVAVCNVQGTDFIIYPAPYSKKLNVILPNHGEKSCTVDEAYCVDYGIDDTQPIHQIQSSEGRVLLRLFNKCALFHLESNFDSIDMPLISMCETEDSFITCCLNPYKNEYVTITNEGLLRVHDEDNVHSNREIELNCLENDNFWSSVHYHDENVLMSCDRQTVKLLDLRTPINESANLHWEVDLLAEKCDSVCSFTKGASLHYVCTDHYLLSLDIRKGWHQRWSHGLTFFPTLLSVVSKEVKDDSLLIGCQMGGSIASVYNSYATDFSIEFIKTPPFQLPSITETLHQARLNGHCLSPLLGPRFSMSLTGLAAVRNSTNLDVFVCNSVGDIFSQRLDLMNKMESITSSLSEREIKCLDLWESECLQQCLNYKSETFASKIISFRDVHQLFEIPATSTDSSDCESLTSTENITSWTWTKQDLDGSSDVLASQLLSCWKLKEDEWTGNFNAEPKSGKDSDSDSDIAMSDDSTVDVNQRIQDWLDQSRLENVDDIPP